MTVQELYNLLAETQRKLDAAGIDDESKLDLEILTKQIKKQIILEILDPLKDLDNVTVVDVSKLPRLCAEVAEKVEDEERRTQLVKKVVAIAKIALKAGGIPIPS